MLVEQNQDLFLTYPIIIMRNGGLDGVALQAREYRRLLSLLDIGVHVMTGRCETKFAIENPIGHKQTIISRLDFYHRDSQLLFANQFEYGTEKEGIAVITDEQWHTLFAVHKQKIKDKIDRVLIDTPHNTPVIVFNLVSLRHAHPAAAAAIHELMLKYPDRAFLSHSADPDAERPEKISRIKKQLLPIISSNPSDQKYSGGPFNLPNLYHIVLNPTQRDNFINKYMIDSENVFEIPDFLDFPSKSSSHLSHPKRIFLQFFSDCCLQSTKNGYKYVNRPVGSDTVFFISPVRPVYRKLLKEAMLVSQQYGKKYECDVAFVVTHPDTDDKQYFLEILAFAESIGLPFFHLGERFTLESLDTVYENMAALRSIGVVASSAGGWENALNEMARACIPFFMNNKLNSFVPLTKEIGVYAHGTDFAVFTRLISDLSAKHIRENDLTAYPEMKSAVRWAHTILNDKQVRTELVEHNYHKAYDYLSYKATLSRLVRVIEHIYKKQGLS